MRSILQDQTNPASDDPSPHLSKAVFFPWTRSSIRTLWGGGRATRMPWRGASEDQPPEERWDRVVQSGKTVWPYVLEIKLVHTRGNKLREIMALTIREDERLRTVTWALEFDTLHPLLGDGRGMTGHGGRITHLTTHKIRPDYILSSSHDYTARMWSLADPVDVPTMPVFWPGQKKVQTDINGDWGFGQMAIGPSERPHFIPVDALVMRTGPPGGVPDPEQAGKGKGACIAVFKGAGSLLGGHDSWACMLCTHLHETGVEYVSWLKEDVLVSISSNFPRIHAGDEEELDDKDRIDVSGTIVVWQWLDLNRFAPEGAEIKEHLVKPSYWDWTESRSYLTLSKIFLFDEEEYSIHTSWTLSSNFGSPLFLLTNRGNRVHVVDIQKYNQSPEEVKSRMKDPEIRAARRGNRREVRYGNRVELKDVPRAQLYAGNSSQSYSILGAVQNPHSPGMIIGLGKDGLLMLWRDGGLRPWSEGVGLGA
ncbi:WD domain, G-beta repeat [Rhizoctonia solani]|uniref:WD domain, G-beta repeat n=1 Tax=Rhizoctonia solani TaxID=456999 RepID=A0A8H7ICY9_9AGAM|nr:WD domain, G-beta repeat [Rhizoctonia solani]